MKPTTVEEYIQNAPTTIQGKLRQIREVIQGAAPHAEEKLSYGMPYYSYKGRLAYFAYAKNHIGLYVMPPIVLQYKDELKEFQTAKATIRFPLEQALPLILIRKLIQASVHANEIKYQATSQKVKE